MATATKRFSATVGVSGPPRARIASYASRPVASAVVSTKRGPPRSAWWGFLAIRSRARSDYSRWCGRGEAPRAAPANISRRPMRSFACGTLRRMALDGIGAGKRDDAFERFEGVEEAVDRLDGVIGV